MMKKIKYSLLPLAFSFVLWLFSGCGDEPVSPPSVWTGNIFIINEGPFTSGTGTIMAYNRTTGQMSGDLFEPVNGRPIGNIVQSIGVYRNMVWIMVNNSNKVEVARYGDFSSVITIDSMPSPRYIAFKGDLAYVSSWNNKIFAIDTRSYKIVDEFPTGTGPDEMVITGDYLFAVNSGGLGTTNTISFINIKQKEVKGEITVGDRPCGIAEDKYGKLWVLCTGNGWNGWPNPETDTPGKLVRIDPATREIIGEFLFSDPALHPDNLIINGERSVLYYAYPDGIYSVSVDNPVLAVEPLVPSTVMYYGLGYDVAEDIIYAADPLDYAQNGIIYRFSAMDGLLIDFFTAGMVPNGFWFN
ncbi:MAG: hypothetical protein KA096_01545 [Bacteroidales bacterium]|nr:hypothetical protein [Bacteroidales bacterium]